MPEATMMANLTEDVHKGKTRLLTSLRRRVDELHLNPEGAFVSSFDYRAYDVLINEITHDDIFQVIHHGHLEHEGERINIHLRKRNRDYVISCDQHGGNMVITGTEIATGENFVMDENGMFYGEIEACLNFNDCSRDHLVVDMYFTEFPIASTLPPRVVWYDNRGTQIRMCQTAENVTTVQVVTTVRLVSTTRELVVPCNMNAITIGDIFPAM